MKKGTDFVDGSFRVGDLVQVTYKDSEPSCSYCGPGTFQSYVTKDTPGYDYCAGDHAMVMIGPADVCCFPLDSLTKSESPKKTRGVPKQAKAKKWSYLTKKLMKDIAAGGIVIAPRRAGKTTAIRELMIKDPSYLLVCHSRDMAECLTRDLLLRGVADAQQRVTGPLRAYLLRGRKGKVIVDEAFWNPAFFELKEYHCAVSSAPKRMVVYNGKGQRVTANAKGEDIWTGYHHGSR